MARASPRRPSATTEQPHGRSTASRTTRTPGSPIGAAPRSRQPAAMSPTAPLPPACAEDASAVRALARLDTARPLRGAVVVGEVDGRPVAAVSLHDGRVVADPFVKTADVVALLRARANRLRGYQPGPRRRAWARPRLAS